MSDLIQRLGAHLASKTGTLPSVSITGYRMLGDRHALVTTVHTHDAGRKANLAALTAMLGGTARPIANSFRRINSKVEARVVSVGYLTVNPIVEELTDDRRANMTTLAKNVLMDNTDESLWNLKETSGGLFITRQADEELGELLASVARPRVGVVATASIASCQPNAGEYVAFVDVNSDEMVHGFVLAAGGETASVLPHGQDEAVSVHNDMIVASLAGVDTDDNFLERQMKRETAGINDAETLKAYYRKLYAYNPEFLAEFEQMIDRQASL